MYTWYFTWLVFSGRTFLRRLERYSVMYVYFTNRKLGFSERISVAVSACSFYVNDDAKKKLVVLLLQRRWRTIETKGGGSPPRH